MKAFNLTQKKKHMLGREWGQQQKLSGGASPGPQVFAMILTMEGMVVPRGHKLGTWSGLLRLTLELPWALEATMEGQGTE